MGPALSVSTSVSEVTKKTITDIMVDSSNKCQSNNINTQTINISDIQTVGCNVEISGISQEQNITTNFTCAQESTNQTELENKLKNDLKQNLETAATAGLGVLSVAVSTDIQKTVDTVANNIDIKTVSECVSTNLNTQLQDIGSIKMKCNPGDTLKIKDLKQSIISSSVASCIQSNKTVQNAINDLQNKLDTSIKTTAQGMQLDFGSMFIIFVIIAICAYFFMAGDEEEEDDTDNKPSIKKKFMSKINNMKKKMHAKS